jgi:hypothetical protein
MKKKFMVLLATGLFVFISITATAMAYEWMPYNGHWYTLSNNGTWDTAEAEAVTLGGHLVTINNALEDAWLASTFTSVQAADIGYYFKDSTNGWQWISGESVIYTHLWNSDTPGYNWWNPDYAGGYYAYLHTESHPFATGWNHAPWVTIDPAYRGIIEITTNPVPLPPTALLLGSGLLGIVGWRRFRKG